MTIRNKKRAKTQFSCKISTLILNLIALERKESKCASDADALELLVLRASNSDAAQKLIMEEAQKNPLFIAFSNALAAQKK